MLQTVTVTLISMLLHSVAIIKYLITKYKAPGHWFPEDIEKRAKIEEYLNWHHNYTRLGAGWLVYFKVRQGSWVMSTHKAIILHVLH